MEYGIWSLHAAAGLWAASDPRLAARRNPMFPGSLTQILPRAMALNAVQRPTEMLPALPFLTNALIYKAMELSGKDNHQPDFTFNSWEQASQKSDDNESNIDRGEDKRNEQIEEMDKQV